MNKNHVFDFILSDAIAKSSSLVEDIKQFAVCSMEERDSRLQVCNNCEYFKRSFCAKCSCYMPLKAYIKKAACPQGFF